MNRMLAGRKMRRPRCFRRNIQCVRAEERSKVHPRGGDAAGLDPRHLKRKARRREEEGEKDK